MATEAEKAVHWMSNPKDRNTFWAAVGAAGIGKEAVHAILEVESVYDFQGGLEDALECISHAVDLAKAFPDDKPLPEPEADASEPEAAPESEADPYANLPHVKTISVVYERKFNLGDYESLHLGFTAWADIPEDEDLDTAQRTLWAYVKSAVKEQALPVIKPAPVSQTKKPTAISPESAAKAAAPVPGTPPPPPPPPVAGHSHPVADALPEAGTDEQLVHIDFIKIASNEDGKTVIQFRRAGRKWPEASYNLSGESFLSQVRGADWFLKNGYTQAHFGDAAQGSIYAVPCIVAWVKSPKSPPGKTWKDIVAITIK